MNDKPTPPPYHDEEPTPFEEMKTGDFSGLEALPFETPVSGETLPGFEDAEGEARPALLVLEGPNRGQRFALDKHVIAIGRMMSADIVVKDSKSSRHHARILYTNFDKPGQEPDCRIFDTGSTNGTYVNGKRVEARGVLLVDRDRVRTGKTVFGFFSNRAGGAGAEDSGISVQTHDETTGLFNLAIFERMLHREVERAKRYQRPLSVLLAAVQGEIMQQRSPGERGEACLRAVAPHVSGALRAHDLCARVGQDRIGAVMPETGIDGAAVVAERICEIIEMQTFQCMEQKVQLHISVGVAELEWDIDTPQKLLEHGASAMLEARGKAASCAVRYDKMS